MALRLAGFREVYQGFRVWGLEGLFQDLPGSAQQAVHGDARAET